MGEILVIGIAGGSGSGKTTVAEMIAEDVGQSRVLMIVQDNYYKDLKHLQPEERAKVNFDHPDSIDAVLMSKHLRALKSGKSIQMPIYDFKTHLRREETIQVDPREVLIVEGILVLERDEIRKLMDVKIFVDTDDDIRFIRRLKRDIVERGRDVDSVINQYLGTVRPMHLEFVDKSKRHADIIIPWRDLNPTAVGMVKNMVHGFLNIKND